MRILSIPFIESILILYGSRYSYEKLFLIQKLAEIPEAEWERFVVHKTEEAVESTSTVL